VVGRGYARAWRESRLQALSLAERRRLRGRVRRGDAPTGEDRDLLIMTATVMRQEVVVLLLYAGLSLNLVAMATFWASSLVHIATAAIVFLMAVAGVRIVRDARQAVGTWTSTRPRPTP